MNMKVSYTEVKQETCNCYICNCQISPPDVCRLSAELLTSCPEDRHSVVLVLWSHPCGWRPTGASATVREEREAELGMWSHNSPAADIRNQSNKGRMEWSSNAKITH